MQSRKKTREGHVASKSEFLDPDYADNLKQGNLANISAEKKRKANEAWMEKLRQGEYSEPTLDRSRYLALREKAVEGNPRHTEAYRQQCREAVGV
eukprot:9212248-Karenia_brevis.AAC.1